MPYFPELRKYKRMQLSVPIEMRRVSEKGRLCRNRLTSYTDDLSAGGIMCEIEKYLPNETVVEIHLVIHRSGVPVKITGEIVWAQQVNGNGTYRIGVEFMKIDRPARNLIVQYIYTNGGAR